MIHFTVAAPMGIDSIFFSFVKRLAEQNGHKCVDAPLEQFDEKEPHIWIEELKRSRHHHFLIGYRYPPPYWRTLVQASSSICLVADPDGITRQVNQIHQNQKVGEKPRDIRSSFQAIEHALEATVDLIMWMNEDCNNHNRVAPLASSFISDSIASFKRLELFYRLAGVEIKSSSAQNFSEEAMPLLQQIEPVSSNVRREIHRLLTLQRATPARLEAIGALFHHVD